MKESDLYDPIKRFFEQQDYEIYAEVMMPNTNRRVDIVARIEGSAEDVMAIELKRSVSKELVQQAIAHRKYFPYVYIGIPERKNKIPAHFQERLLFYGIGILEVTTLGSTMNVKVRQHAMFQEPTQLYRKKWDQILLPEHQEWVKGGSAGGGYVTQYALTMEKIKKYLYDAKGIDSNMTYEEISISKYGDRQGWRTAADIVENCPTHWGNPKGSAVQSLLEFESRWVDAKKINGKWHFRCKAGFVPRGTIRSE